ncbi:MAG: hypothetical protein WA323_22055, partial [Candidatus Nitrosopolaris sp.]
MINSYWLLAIGYWNHLFAYHTWDAFTKSSLLKVQKFPEKQTSLQAYISIIPYRLCRNHAFDRFSQSLLEA